jgi:hypothetical protein
MKHATPRSLYVVLVLGACAPACAGKTVDVGTLGTGTGSLAVLQADSPPAPSPTQAIILGDQAYVLPTCGEASGESGMDGWVMAPARLYFAPSPVCDWPADRPLIDISVYLRDFDVSSGFPPGTYDLADPKLDNVFITVEVTNLSDHSKYQRFSSSAETLPSSAQVVPNPGVSGKVTVAQYSSVRTDIDSSPVYDITLTDLVLPVHGEASTWSWGDTAHVVYAHLAGDTP